VAPVDHLDDDAEEKEEEEEEEDDDDAVVARLETPAAFTAVETAYRSTRWTWRASQHEYRRRRRVAHRRTGTGRDATSSRGNIIIRQGIPGKRAGRTSDPALLHPSSSRETPPRVSLWTAVRNIFPLVLSRPGPKTGFYPWRSHTNSKTVKTGYHGRPWRVLRLR
jgi:hypothetical protein